MNACKDLPAHVWPAGALVTRRAFTIAAGELTANLKLRRRRIEANQRVAIDLLLRGTRRRGPDPRALSSRPRERPVKLDRETSIEASDHRRGVAASRSTLLQVQAGQTRVVHEDLLSDRGTGVVGTAIVPFPARRPDIESNADSGGNTVESRGRFELLTRFWGCRASLKSGSAIQAAQGDIAQPLLVERAGTRRHRTTLHSYPALRGTVRMNLPLEEGSALGSCGTDRSSAWRDDWRMHLLL